MDLLEQARAAIAREDFDEALAILEPLGEGGNAEAQFLLGYLFFTDAPIEHDEATAWIRRAAARGHPDALFYDACFRNPPEVDLLFGPPDDTARWEQTMLAAELGSAEAQVVVGSAFRTASFDPTANFPWSTNMGAGRLWTTRAAEQGEPDAQYYIGMDWLHGDGGPADPEIAIAWLTRAAQHEYGTSSDTAAEVLANLYATGNHGVRPDPQAAAYWREQAKRLKAAPARCGCATCRGIRAALSPTPHQV